MPDRAHLDAVALALRVTGKARLGHPFSGSGGRRDGQRLEPAENIAMLDRAHRSSEAACIQRNRSTGTKSRIRTFNVACN
jgi:hypothetical protein